MLTSALRHLKRQFLYCTGYHTPCFHGTLDLTCSVDNPLIELSQHQTVYHFGSGNSYYLGDGALLKKEVTTLRIFADYHTHTVHSHGRGTVEDNVKAAISANLRAIAITDHGPANLFGVGVKNLDVFQVIRQEIIACQRKFPHIQILLGVEANIIDLDGTLDVPLERLHEFDIILAGLHLLVHTNSLLSGMVMAGNLIGRYCPVARNRLRKLNTQAVIAALTQYPIDILTHPGLNVDIDTRAVAEVAAQTGTYMEISTRHHNIQPSYLETAFVAGARFVISSDAHSPGEVGEGELGTQLAKAAAIPPWAIHNLS